MAENNVIPEQPKATTDKYEVVHAKSKLFYPEYERKSDLKHQTHYCPGCGHGVAHKLIAEALEDLGLQDRNHPGQSRWAARFSPTTISTWATCKLRTAALPPRPPA